jgi:hypothetical protein
MACGLLPIETNVEGGLAAEPLTDGDCAKNASRK